ncbi:nucleotidyltransferase family protein [Vibrio sp. PNB23_22_6]
MIIAAGESNRFGGYRLLNELDSDHSLLSHAVEQALGCKSTSVFVVIGRWHNENGRLAEVPLIYNPEWSLELGSSIAHGVRTLAADYDAICITLADQITLRSEDFNQLISSSPPGHIVCSYYKRKRGVPALFPSCCFNQLIQLKGSLELETSCEAIAFRLVKYLFLMLNMTLIQRKNCLNCEDLSNRGGWFW